MEQNKDSRNRCTHVLSLNFLYWYYILQVWYSLISFNSFLKGLWVFYNVSIQLCHLQIETVLCLSFPSLCLLLFLASVLSISVYPYPYPRAVLYLVAQSCLTLCVPTNGSPPGSSPWGFCRQEYWSGLPCPPPGDLLNPGTGLRFPALQVDSLLT